jgi:hypothetical protein
MKIVWSDEAITDYHQNIDYLMKEWSEQVAVEFIEDVEDCRPWTIYPQSWDQSSEDTLF